jgi:pimeloyl-ACP methyl ester carboxylesterase
MNQMTSRVTSADGTTIAYHRQGAGPAVILVGGSLDDGAENAPLVPVLAEHFTVYNYARRGRGGSGDTPPYAVRREIEDLDALIAAAGGSAHLYGVSSGGALALEAAAAGSAVDKLAVYEVPYAIGDDLRPRFERYIAETQRAYDEGRRDDMLELFMRVTGASDEVITAGRESPFWAQSAALADTLVHDPVFLDGYRLPADRLGEVTQPVLVVTGGPITEPHMSDLPSDFFDRAGDALAAAVPNAERRTLEGQGHMADPKAIAPLLKTFFHQ